MSIIGDITNTLTGGSNSNASDALNQALGEYTQVQPPSQTQLTLPQLQSYVDAGLMTPAQMQAYLQQNNALATENTPQTGTAAQIAALNQLSGVANAGAAGTPVEQAQQAQTIQAMNEAVGGQRGAIEQAAEARGDPQALVQSALENQSVGQDAQQAYQNSLQSQAQAYQAALNAMSQGASVGQGLQGQQNMQANTVAQAQNAMQQFNAQNQQAASAANQNAQQQANEYNAQNAQNVSNANTQNVNERTAYNAKIPQQMFENSMQKAQGQAGVNEQQAANQTQQGKQNSITSGGIGQSVGNLFSNSGGLGSLGSMFGGGSAGAAGSATGSGAGGEAAGYGAVADAALMSKGGLVPGHENCFHEGGLCMKQGGMVPGKPKVPGDSIQNDVVTAKVSPGEAVIPRTAVQAHMPQVLSLLAGHGQPPPAPAHHPEDIASLLQGMKKLRGAA
jgi:hypothetical protein